MVHLIHIMYRLGASSSSIVIFYEGQRGVLTRKPFLVLSLVTAVATGCSSQTLVPSQREMTVSDVMASPESGSATSQRFKSRKSFDATDDVPPIPTDSFVPFIPGALKNHVMTQAELSQVIDPSIPAASQATIEQALSSIQLADFDPSATAADYAIAVADLGSGNIVYNRPELAGAMGVQFVCITCTIKTRLPDNEVEPYNPSQDMGTGPYRRMVSSYREPYLTTLPNGGGMVQYGPMMSGMVYLHNKSASIKPMTSAGDVYMGGFSSQDGANELGTSVDAGLQYNLRGGSSNDTYTPFVNVGKLANVSVTTTANNSNGQQVYNGPFSWGTPTLIKNSFNVSQDQGSEPPGPITFSDTSYGLDPSSGRNRTVIVVAMVPPGMTDSNGDFNGWDVTCQYCVLKYVTSIAQNGGENLHDGSHFYGDQEQIMLDCGFFGGVPCGDNGMAYWNQSSTLNCTEYANWGPGFNSALRDCKDGPGLPYDNVIVQGFAYSGSGILIQDPTPAPSPSPTPTPTPAPTPTIRLPVVRPSQPGCRTVQGRHCLPDGTDTPLPIPT